MARGKVINSHIRISVYTKTRARKGKEFILCRLYRQMGRSAGHGTGICTANGIGNGRKMDCMEISGYASAGSKLAFIFIVYMYDYTKMLDERAEFSFTAVQQYQTHTCDI